MIGLWLTNESCKTRHFLNTSLSFAEQASINQSKLVSSNRRSSVSRLRLTAVANDRDIGRELASADRNRTYEDLRAPTEQTGNDERDGQREPNREGAVCASEGLAVLGAAAAAAAVAAV